MLRTITLLSFIVALAASFECDAQNIPQQDDTTTLWRIETNDDNEFIGRILGVENGVVTFMTDKFGVMSIRQADIKSIEEVDPKRIINDVYWADNFQSTRYFWMPNGFGLKPGEAYYQNVWILFNQFSIGITKNLSVGLGTLPIYLFGAEAAPFWITPKVSLPVSKKVNLGVGVLYLRLFDFSGDNNGSDGGGGVAYGVVTLGSRDRNASFGVGYGFNGQNFSERPVFSFSTMTRLGQRSYLMTENYIFVGQGDSDTFGLISVGGRRLMKRVGLDFGGFLPITPGQQRIFIIPWLGLSVPLGKQHLAD